MANQRDLTRLHIPPASTVSQYLQQGGFEPYFRDDGIHPDASPDVNAAYNHYLRQHGFDTDNPWHEYTHGATDEAGNFQSGWFLENSHRAAAIPEEHSETTVTTTQAMVFIDEVSKAEQPWCLHLSYIKPHWPFMTPAPCAQMFGTEEVLPANRSAEERNDPHPVVAAFMQHQDSLVYTQPGARERVIPTYMGLVKQIDDQIGRLLAFLEERELLDSTLIVFTSDHGDYLGDHWLGEKELFHEESVRVPALVIVSAK